MINNNLQIPELSSDECIKVLQLDNIIEICNLNIKEAGFYKDKKKRIDKINIARSTISDIQKLRRKMRKNIENLSDEQRESMNISVADTDYFVLRAFRWIDKSSTPNFLKVTKRGKIRATGFFYSHPKNKEKLATYMLKKIKEDQQNKAIDKKAKSSRNERKRKNKIKKRNKR